MYSFISFVIVCWICLQKHGVPEKSTSLPTALTDSPPSSTTTAFTNTSKTIQSTKKSDKGTSCWSLDGNGTCTTEAPTQHTSETRKKIVTEIEELTVESYFSDALYTSDVTSYIFNLPNGFHSHLVFESLRYCPFTPLCNISLNVSTVFYFHHIHTTPISEGRISCCLTCSCEPECVSQGDCCPDAPSVLASRTVPQLPKGIQRECIPRGIADGGNNLNDRVERVKAITGCPMDTNIELLAKCNRDYKSEVNNLTLADVVVVSNTVNGNVYRNQHCALCNGINTASMTLWQPELFCVMSRVDLPRADDVLALIMAGRMYCDLTFVIPEQFQSQIESCSKYVATCNITGLWHEYNETIEKGCATFGTPIESKSEVLGTVKFRNPFCALCNGFIPSFYDTCYYSKDNIEKYSFSGMLRLQDRNTEVASIEAECPTGFLYDKYKDYAVISKQEKCREVLCADGRQYVDSKCLQVTDFRFDTFYEYSITIKPITNLFLQRAYNIAPFLKEWLTLTSRRIKSPSLTCGPQVVLYIDSDKDYLNNLKSEYRSLELVFYEIRYRMLIEGQHNATDVIDRFLGLNDAYIQLENGTVSNLGTNVKFRKLKDTIPLFKVNVIEANGTIFDLVTGIELTVYNQTSQGRKGSDMLSLALENTIRTENAVLIPYLDQFNKTERCSSNEEATNILSLRSCPMFELSFNEFQWKTSLHGLYMETPQVSLGLSEYSYTSGNHSNSTNILICVDTYSTKFVPSTDMPNVSRNDVVFLITLISYSVSIASLLISFVTYCIFEELRNLPGKNNMAMIVFLLVAQTTFLLSITGVFNSGTMSCKVLGLVAHFFWLLALFWMQICTFHIYTVLTKIRPLSSDNGNRKHFIYHIYCLAITTLFVMVNVVDSLIQSDNADIGYGRSKCFVSTQKMTKVTFGIPAFLVILSNVAMFLVVVVKLKRAPAVDKNVKNERNYCLVFAKLSTVIGASGFFAFVNMWTGIIAFIYIFILLNASQGVFIMLGFVCNSRTLGLYRDRSKELHSVVCKRRSNRLESTSS